MSRYTDGTHDDFIAAVTPLLPPVCEGDTVPLSKRFVESEEGDWIDLAKPTGDVINGEPQYHFAAEDDLLAVGINPDGDELPPDDIRARAWERYTEDAGKLGGCFTAFDAAARYIIDAVRAQQKDASKLRAMGERLRRLGTCATAGQTRKRAPVSPVYLLNLREHVKALEAENALLRAEHEAAKAARYLDATTDDEWDAWVAAIAAVEAAK
jgi:hypothetical protein